MRRFRVLSRFVARRFIVLGRGVAGVVVRLVASGMNTFVVAYRHAYPCHHSRHTLNGQDDRNDDSKEAEKL